MRKPIAVGVAVIFGVVVVGAAACSSSSNGDDSSSPTGDANVGDVSCGSNCPANEAGPPSDGGGSDPACFNAAAVISFSTTPLAPAASQHKCASDDLVSQFIGACVISTVDAGGLTCDQFVAANLDCALCLGAGAPADAGTPPAMPWPALTPIDTTGDDIPSVAACVAAISAGIDTCKLNFANVDLCTRSGCAACTGADLVSCVSTEPATPNGDCLTKNPIDTACTSAINAAQGDAPTKCGSTTKVVTNADFVAVLMKVGRTMCE